MSQGEMTVHDPDLVREVRHLSSAVADLSRQVQEGSRKTVAEIHSLAQSTANTELAKQRAEVEAVGRSVGRLRSLVTSMARQVSERVGAIRQRFDRTETELKGSYRRDLRSLGQHIFEILEDEYQRCIEDRVRSAGFDLFARLAGTEYQRRNMLLLSSVQRAKESARVFADRRRQFKTTIADIKLDSVLNGDRQFAVPFWVIEASDDEGRTWYYVLGPGSLKRTQMGDYGYAVESLAEYSGVRSLVQNKVDTVVGQLHWREASEGERNAISGLVGGMGQDTISSDLKRVILRHVREKSLTIA